MSETNITTEPEKSEVVDAFSSEHAWMVQCLSLAALALMVYINFVGNAII